MNNLLEISSAIDINNTTDITFEYIRKLLREDPNHNIACRIYYDSKLYDELVGIDDAVLRVVTVEYMDKLSPDNKSKTTDTAQWTLFFDDVYVRCTMVKHNDYLDTIFSVPTFGAKYIGEVRR